MCPASKPARTTERCKIKPVDPAFRSVSTPRATKDLLECGPVHLERALGQTGGSSRASNWRAERVSESLRSELTPWAWNRPVCGAACVGYSVDQLLRSMFPEVA